jgi:SAM-dependent methyltransferase
MRCETCASAASVDSSLSPVDPNFYGVERLRRYESLQGEAGRVKDREMNALDAIFARRKLDGAPCDSFLDLGTCTGRYLRWAQARGFSQVAGMDHSPHVVPFCREEIGLQDCDLHTADCTEESSFVALRGADLITMMMGTVHHLTSKGVSQMMTNIADIARDEAQFVVSTWRDTPMDLELYTPREVRDLGSIDYAALLRRESGRHWVLQDVHETPSLRLWLFLRL